MNQYNNSSTSRQEFGRGLSGQASSGRVSKLLQQKKMADRKAKGFGILSGTLKAIGAGIGALAGPAGAAAGAGIAGDLAGGLAETEAQKSASLGQALATPPNPVAKKSY